MMAPKRFPDRDEIAVVRAEAEPLEAGGEGDHDPPRRRTRDGAARHGQARVPRRRRPFGADPGDLRHEPARASSTCTSVTWSASSGAPPSRSAASRRSSPDEVIGPGAQPQPAAGHVPRAHRRRAALPQAVPRPAHERRDARRLPAPQRASSPRSARYLDGEGFVEVETPILQPRYGGGLRAAVRHALERARRRLLPPYRHGAVPQAADRRRPGAGVRARQGLSQRGRLVQAPARVHDARVVRGVRRLPRHHGADRGARREGRARGAGPHEA